MDKNIDGEIGLKAMAYCSGIGSVCNLLLLTTTEQDPAISTMSVCAIALTFAWLSGLSQTSVEGALSASVGALGVFAVVEGGN